MSNAAIQEYQQVRKPGDFDLVLHVRTMLINAGSQPSAIEAYDSHHLIVEASDKVPTIQRFLLNRFWMLQLMNCPDVSTKERYCLIPNGTIDDWVRLFGDSVLPFAMRNNLPTFIL